MSRVKIQPNPENSSLAEIETAAKCAPTMKAHDRYFAIKALIMGFSRESVAQLYGVTDRTFRRWINAFNDKGLDGLIDEAKPGRQKKIPPEIQNSVNYPPKGIK